MDTNDGRAPTTLAEQQRDGSGSAEWLFVVRIEESCDPRLIGREGLACEVPPQPLAEAQRLVCLLLLRGQPEGIVEDTYAVAVAGGRQTITLRAVNQRQLPAPTSNANDRRNR
jgi:hypothetical protein